MAKTKKKVLDSYTIQGTKQTVKVGDSILMQAHEPDRPPYVAKLEKIEEGSKANVRVRVRWYYRPEDSIGGRRQFHGSKELFLSDHFDEQSADTIEGKCIVHTFRNYTKLSTVGSGDYFCRFEYKAASGSFSPDRVAVYCKCEMPYNPDDLMVQCDACKDWFHPECLKMSSKVVKKLEHYFCPDCATQNGEKTTRKLRSKESSPQKAKVESQAKRRRR